MKKRGLSNEEKLLWAQLTSKTTPLKKEKNEEKDFRLNKHDIRRRVEFNQEHRAGLQSLPLFDLLLPSAPKKSTRRITRIRGITIEARLDLHGHTKEQAFERLQKFLKKGQEQGLLWILVITGKGSLSATEKGVLQQALPLWLEELPQVGAYATAKIEDGGTGALYVRLKKASIKL